ncbi:MAG: hypothetical protein WD749_07165 [Phycisphaerales bacterium]
MGSDVVKQYQDWGHQTVICTIIKRAEDRGRKFQSSSEVQEVSEQATMVASALWSKAVIDAGPSATSATVAGRFASSVLDWAVEYLCAPQG